MKIKNKDIKIEITKGQGPGGQHRNKTSSAVRMTHIPTGISVFIDGRHQGQNKKKARIVLQEKLDQYEDEIKQKKKKADRDRKIHDHKYIRTYNFLRNTVKDHRTKQEFPLDKILKEGRLDLFYNGLRKTKEN